MRRVVYHRDTSINTMQYEYGQYIMGVVKGNITQLKITHVLINNKK